MRCTPQRAEWRAHVCVAALFVSLAAADAPGTAVTQRDWVPGGDASLAGPCTVERRAWTELSQDEFDAVYLESLPVVLTGLPDNARIRELCARHRLLADWGNHTIVLATSNTYSYAKTHMSLHQYVAEHMAPQPADRSGKESLYHFGDNNRTEWAPLLSTYIQPPFIPPSAYVSLSFGLAGPGSGVPFHIHGAGYSETIVGRKRWLLYAPEQKPPFDPDESTLAWLKRWQAGDGDIAAHGAPLDCTLSPGEAIYFPSRWWHATLNLDEAVFMSTFVSYAPAPRSAAPLLRRAGPVPFPGDVLAPAQRETELRRQRH